MGWITARLFQASTIKGIIQLGGSLGLWNVSDSMQTAIIATVMGILGLINVIVDEHKAAAKVASVVAVDVATDTAKTAVERDLPWLVKQEVKQQAKD